ncbi:MAG: maleylacetate reductase [Pseudomonadota bacterium]
MEPFEYTAHPARVIFGSGTTQRAGEEAARLGIERALVLSTPAQADDAQRLQTDLQGRGTARFCEAAMHTPVEVTERAMALVHREDIDGVIAFGGGSTIGLGKAIALRTDLPQLVIPTTYAGSEMTAIIGQTEGGQKTTQKTLKVLPETVIYDVDHTLGLPLELSITSGLNAIAHAVESLYAEQTNPALSLMAEEGIRSLAAALTRIPEYPRSASARSDALYGAWLCATCLGLGGVALHHKLCHVLGGSFDLPHAQTHTVILPHALAYNAPAVPEAMGRLRRALDTQTPAAALFDIARAADAPTSLAALGMPREGIPRAIDITLANPYFNPRTLERAALEGLLEDAFAGRCPEC